MSLDKNTKFSMSIGSIFSLGASLVTLVGAVVLATLSINNTLSDINDGIKLNSANHLSRIKDEIVITKDMLKTINNLNDKISSIDKRVIKKTANRFNVENAADAFSRLQLRDGKLIKPNVWELPSMKRRLLEDQN